MKNDSKVINEMMKVASLFNHVGVSAHADEINEMVKTEIECRGINFEMFEVHVANPGQYEVIVIRNTELLARKIYKNLDEVESALRFRIATNKILK